MNHKPNANNGNAAPVCGPTPTTNGGRCLKPGPVVRNPYLNFLREYRKNNCGLSAVETVRRGAAAWRSLPKEEKLQYIVEAFYAKRYRRRRKTTRRLSAKRKSNRLRGAKPGNRLKNMRGMQANASAPATQNSNRGRSCSTCRPTRMARRLLRRKD